MTIKKHLSNEKKRRLWQKWRFNASYDSFVGKQLVVNSMNICGDKRHLHPAENRYRQLFRPPTHKKLPDFDNNFSS